MAKKGQAVQLQTEVGNDEEWEKLLQRDGLIVVDVYSEWCGPCSGMAATLKKLKLEIGGDLLQLATAKSDKITVLERFRNKSEPTWMFIVNGKMVNFMFGANAPKLTRLIIEELKKENEARQGLRERVQNNLTDLTDEERERLEVVENMEREAKEKEMQKAAKELHERRTAEAHNILENLRHFGVILIFPHAKTMYLEAFGDLLGEAGLTIAQTEKINITDQHILDELFYFGTNPFPQESIEQLLAEQSIVLLVKPIPARDVTEPTDEILLSVVYGNMKEAPGSLESPASHLAKVPQESEEGEQTEPLEMIGVWVPENELIKASALRLFFPKITDLYLIPEPEPTPPHYAVAFEAFRRHEVADLMDKYPNEIIRYGFFTSEVPESATLIAKTIKKYEKASTRTPNDRMVIELSKKKSECVLAFAQIKPYYMSPNTTEGDRECKLFFSDDYDEPPEEEPDTESKKSTAEAEGENDEIGEPPVVAATAAVTEAVPETEAGAETEAGPETEASPEIETAPGTEAAPETEAGAVTETAPVTEATAVPPGEKTTSEEVPHGTTESASPEAAESHIPDEPVSEATDVTATTDEESAA